MKKVLYILGQLEDADLQWLRDAGRKRCYVAGEVVVREGVRQEHLFIVLAGELVVKRVHQDQELARLGSGEIVGEISLLDSRPPIATVVAAQETELFCVSHDSIRVKLATDSGFAARFYRALCVFLANRLNRTVAMVGMSSQPNLSEESEKDEISPEAMEQVSLAGARFDWFLQQLARD